jgi:hypothetical protein
MRTPSTLLEFLPHKFRKSNAFLKESLRFVYRLPEMGTLFKVILLTRTAQQLLLPWMILWWVLIAGALLTLFRVDVVFFGTVFLVALLAMGSRVFVSVKLPIDQPSYGFVTLIKGYILTTAILLATGLSYPFFRQGSSYSRFTSTTPAVDQMPKSSEIEDSHG